MCYHKNMKKALVSLFAVVLCALFAFALGGCIFRAEEDVIPTKFGSPEGLYLYSGNRRMKTDGSCGEDVLTTVEIDGQTYQSGEFTVSYVSSYIPEKHLAYFIIDLNENRYVYLYDYMEKKGKVADTLPFGESIEYSSSKTHFFVRTESVNILYGAEGVSYKDFDGTLKDDLLYSIDDEKKLEWVYNGEYHCAVSEHGRIFIEKYMRKSGKYVYFYRSDARYKGFTAVDLETGEYYRPPQLNDEQAFPYDDCFWLNGEEKECSHLAEGSLYLLLIFVEQTSDDDSKWHTYLYKVTGGEVTVEYYFKNPRYGSYILGTTENYIYVAAKYNGRGITSYYSYDKRSGKTKKVSRPSGSEIAGQRDNYIRVGKYEFFTETVEYRIPDSNTMFGSRIGYCHYLYRKSTFKKEIMRYSLDSNDFYDDICTF